MDKQYIGNRWTTLVWKSMSGIFSTKVFTYLLKNKSHSLFLHIGFYFYFIVSNCFLDYISIHTECIQYMYSISIAKKRFFK